ncbi:MAG: hypothetical protein IJ205_08175 [Bacteroidales bacterium]|nr:hypothetical protein [Bacteroidales bacterium]
MISKPSGSEEPGGLSWEDIRGLSGEITHQAIIEGKALVESEAAGIYETQRKIMSFLGWYFAAFVSCLGAFVVQLAAAKVNLFLAMMTLYGSLAVLIPAVIMAKGSIFKVYLFRGGCRPSDYLYSDILEWIEKHFEPCDAPLAMEKTYLLTLQKMCDHNTKMQDRVVKSYRQGLAASAVTLSFGTILAIVLRLII